MSIAIIPSNSLAQIATEHPMSTRVFARHQMDFCCGGNLPLLEICEKKGLDVLKVVEEICNEVQNSKEEEVRWDQTPLDDLMDHILARYHQPLKEELPRLEAMLDKVYQVHGEKDPERLLSLVNVFRALKEELKDHMEKEEVILFPMIRTGQGAMAGCPISVMEMEHKSAGASLCKIRQLTDEYQVPSQACNTWRALWHGLKELEESTHQHIHLENNILHPRALSSS
ncbi:MAG: iron-sulfur cluster repair di-iron protein [Planctomycetota bacterium]|jgi:regulator of cell morphogenesis and NO signaling|nr:iron-sulfur cluster repair di-iron protein [Planctomycetota bacterium]